MCAVLREMSVRRDPRSGELSNRVDINADRIAGMPLAVILIHGYNNDEAEARASFVDFQKLLIQLRLPKFYLNSIWRFYWPGNARNAILSTLSYPVQIGKAEESALRLSRFLNEILASSRVTEFVFIAHSLGCRLLLETLKLITHSGRPQIKLSSLMAAAVPSKMIEDKTLDVRIRGYRSIAGLFSPNDKVLRFAFPPGEAARLEGLFPEALGLNGRPMSFWSAGWMNTGLNHGEYWSDNAVAGFLARGLGLVVPRTLQTSEIQSRETPIYRDGKFSEQ